LVVLVAGFASRRKRHSQPAVHPAAANLVHVQRHMQRQGDEIAMLEEIWSIS
jgi:hypothetical protein